MITEPNEQEQEAPAADGPPVLEFGYDVDRFHPLCYRVFTMGNHRNNMPELYCQHMSIGLANLVMVAVYTLWKEKPPQEGIINLVGHETMQGEPVRYQIKKLSGGERYAVADAAHAYLMNGHTRYLGDGNMIGSGPEGVPDDCEAMYANEFYQIVIPDENNQLPSEVKDYDLVSGMQTIRSVTVH